MPLRGAISGFGEVAAQAHLAGWRTRPDVNIVAIHDPVSAARHRAMNLIKNVRVYDDLELMVDGEALDFLDIASPPAFHAASARMALEAGAHVLVEKPLCLDAAEFAGLMALATEKSRVLMCVHNWKYSPAYQRAYELVSQGHLGRLRYISLVRLRGEPAGAEGTLAGGGERWRLDARTGGGILIDHGWHVFYLMRWLMGGVDPSGVSAYLDAARGAAVDDLADIRVEFPDGRIAYSHVSWRAPARRTSAVLYGDKAILEIEGNRVLLTERSGVVHDCSVSDTPDDSYHAGWFAGVAAHFEQALRDGPSSPLVRENLAEAQTALMLILGARQSATSGSIAVKIAI
jgi:predicted dehydrogenase